MSSTIFTDADWLNMAQNVGYGQLPIPDSKDDLIQQLIQKWTKLNEKERIRAGESLKENQRFTLLAYSERMASLAVRRQSMDYIYLGLIALGIDGWRKDWRDNAVLLALHYDATKRLGGDFRRTFQRAEKLLPQKVAKAFRAFLRRSEEDKSLGAMGYEIGEDEYGFNYKRTW